VTECSGCGSCCENIHLNASWDEIESLALAVSPLDDWDAWLANDWTDFEKCLRKWWDARFIWEHWHLNLDAETYGCDVFDEGTRRCTDHANRPPVCRGYPWYGRAPDMTFLHPACSFRADQPTPIPVSIRSRGVGSCAMTSGERVG
jgi:Fe-S-cluster containining protein